MGADEASALPRPRRRDTVGAEAVGELDDDEDPPWSNVPNTGPGVESFDSNSDPVGVGVANGEGVGVGVGVGSGVGAEGIGGALNNEPPPPAPVAPAGGPPNEVGPG